MQRQVLLERIGFVIGVGQIQPVFAKCQDKLQFHSIGQENLLWGHAIRFFHDMIESLVIVVRQSDIMSDLKILKPILGANLIPTTFRFLDNCATSKAVVWSRINLVFLSFYTWDRQAIVVVIFCRHIISLCFSLVIWGFGTLIRRGIERLTFDSTGSKLRTILQKNFAHSIVLVY